jgi:ankyrin repeat protein
LPLRGKGRALVNAALEGTMANILKAALESNHDKLREALSSGETIDSYDANGMTPLLYAVFIGNIDAVRMLLDEGADCNRPHRGDATATPLWHAQEDFGLFEIAEILREHGARL